MITYITGDATQPVSTPAIIAHICNNRGGWGAGFTGALSKRWPRAEELYRYCWRNRHNHNLGSIQVATVGQWVAIVNMIAQNGYSKPGKPAIDYTALLYCLRSLAVVALRDFPTYTVHIPRIGTDRAGGEWAVIEPMIEQELCEKGIQVTVYDLPVTKGN